MSPFPGDNKSGLYRQCTGAGKPGNELQPQHQTQDSHRRILLEFVLTTTHTFRVFVSSTFDDLREERNILQEHLFPKLEKFCLEKGTRFQAIDLRWGVREEAGFDQKTMDICLA